MTDLIGVTGSPRKNGNTHVLVSRVLQAAAEQGAATDSAFLADMTIRECDGCHACWKTQQCVKADDMIGLYGRLAESRVWILGTPIYWYGPTAIMKAFIDRMVYFNCPQTRAKVRGKTAALVIPFEEESEEMAASTVQFFEKCLAWLEIKLAGTLLVPGVTEKGEVLRLPERMRQAEELGRRLSRCK
jgi:multimeric flavodoxin WrbA